MPKKELRAFIEALQADEELQKKLIDAADAQDIIQLAKEAGFLISPEDINSANRELEDSDLEGVTGGGFLQGIKNGSFPMP